MAITNQPVVLHPELLTEAVKAGLSGVACFEGTRCAVTNMSLSNGKGVAGTEVKVPYFASLGEFEDITTDGDALTPALLEQSSEVATVQHSGKAFEITRFAAGAVGDPYKEAARQIVAGAKRRFERALISVASDTTAWDHMLVDVYDAGTPKYLDYDRLVDAKVLFGDEAAEEEMTLFIASKVKGDLMRLKDSTGRPLLTDPTMGAPGRFCGIPYRVSDLLASSAFGAVTETGTTPPTFTVAGTPASAGYNFRIECTTAGNRGTFKFRWSEDGGGNWHTNVLSAATVVLGTTGATVSIENAAAALNNVWTFGVAGSFKSLLCLPQSLALWADSNGSTIQTDRDITKDADIAALHVYFAAHRYKRMPGMSKGGVVVIKHNAGRPVS